MAAPLVAEIPATQVLYAKQTRPPRYARGLDTPLCARGWLCLTYTTEAALSTVNVEIHWAKLLCFPKYQAGQFSCEYLN